MLDRPYPHDGTICYPQGRHALESTWEKSKRKTKRNLPTEYRIEDAGGRNQLIRAEEKSKRKATVPCHFPCVPIGIKGIKCVSTVPTHFFPFCSISIASFSLVQRIRNFGHYELPEKSIFQNLRKTALITYLAIVSISAAYFSSLRLVRGIRNFGHYKTRKKSSFQNIPEAAQPTCFIATSMSVAHFASLNPVRRITNFGH